MDGTLMDSLPDIANSSRYLLKLYNLPSVDDRIVRSMIGDGIQLLVERLLDQAGTEAKFINRKEATDHFIEYYSDHSSDYTKPFENAEKCLENFKLHNWAIALCTNKITKVAKDILKHHHLDHFFDVVGGGDSFAHKKPHACHLEGIMKEINAKAARTVMVGDHLNDILVAKNAHIAGSIFALWGYGKLEIGDQATRVAKMITDLPKIAEDIIRI